MVPPGEGSGPGILVLHAWWGLTPVFKQICDRLAESGFVALAPDLYHGRTASDPADAESLLAETDMDETVRLVSASIVALQSMPGTPDGRVGVVGFSMGASLAFWAATRMPDHVGATVAYYGAQSMDMADATSPFLGHFAETDTFVSDDEVTLLEADLKLLGKDATFHRYPGTEHWFAEPDQVAYDPDAAELAWERSVRFFREHLGTGSGPRS